MKKEPMYRKIYNSLKLAIQTDYEQGEKIPSEPELEKQYSASRITIRKAVQMLADEGLVHIQQGRGTTVCDSRDVQNINYLTSLSETLLKMGYQVKSANICIDEIIPSSHILGELHLPERSKVYRIQRLILADKRPIALATNYIAPHFAPDFMQRMHNQTFKYLYQFLEKEYGILFTTAQDYITARAANLAQAQALRIPPNSPLIHLHRITYSKTKPVTYDDLLIDSSHYQLSASLSGRPILEQP